MKHGFWLDFLNLIFARIFTITIFNVVLLFFICFLMTMTLQGNGILS